MVGHRTKVGGTGVFNKLSLDGPPLGLEHKKTTDGLYFGPGIPAPDSGDLGEPRQILGISRR
jgi:hypothetical protein